MVEIYRTDKERLPITIVVTFVLENISDLQNGYLCFIIFNTLTIKLLFLKKSHVSFHLVSRLDLKRIRMKGKRTVFRILLY